MRGQSCRAAIPLTHTPSHPREPPEDIPNSRGMDLFRPPRSKAVMRRRKPSHHELSSRLLPVSGGTLGLPTDWWDRMCAGSDGAEIHPNSVELRPPESPGCCCDSLDHSCCDWRSGSSARCCSMSRRDSRGWSQRHTPHAVHSTPPGIRIPKMKGKGAKSCESCLRVRFTHG